MNDNYDAARLRREELDRQIESIRTERFLAATTAPSPGLPDRARTTLGRGLISLGTALLGAPKAGTPAAGRSRAAAADRNIPWRFTRPHGPRPDRLLASEYHKGE